MYIENYQGPQPLLCWVKVVAIEFLSMINYPRNQALRAWFQNFDMEAENHN